MGPRSRFFSRRADRHGRPAEALDEDFAGRVGAELDLAEHRAADAGEPGGRVEREAAPRAVEFLLAMGAEVRLVPPVPFSDRRHYFHQAGALSEEHGWFWANQFENPSNGDFHYQTTGPEIWEQCEGRIDVLVSSVGSGGTISGVSRELPLRARGRGDADHRSAADGRLFTADPLMSIGSLQAAQRKHLEELVGLHKVVFRVAPAREPMPEGIVAVGFDVELAGAHGKGAGSILPGCDKCLAIWRDLEEIAAAVVPEGVRPSRTERSAFDHALRSRANEKRDDVQLMVTIRHRGDFAAPIDDCEERCLKEIKADLRALGACENQWKVAGEAAR